MFKRITNNHSSFQSQQQTQATDIRDQGIPMILNLLYVERTSAKLRRILKSHKMRSTFTESTLHKPLHKRKIKELQKIKTISFIKLTV